MFSIHFEERLVLNVGFQYNNAACIEMPTRKNTQTYKKRAKQSIHVEECTAEWKS